MRARKSVARIMGVVTARSISGRNGLHVVEKNGATFRRVNTLAFSKWANSWTPGTCETGGRGEGLTGERAENERRKTSINFTLYKYTPRSWDDCYIDVMCMITVVFRHSAFCQRTILILIVRASHTLYDYFNKANCAITATFLSLAASHSHKLILFITVIWQFSAERPTSRALAKSTWKWLSEQYYSVMFAMMALWLPCTNWFCNVVRDEGEVGRTGSVTCALVKIKCNCVKNLVPTPANCVACAMEMIGWQKILNAITMYRVVVLSTHFS